MKKAAIQRLFIAAILVLLLPRSTEAKPAVFSDKNLGQAQEQAKTENKLLVVDFTASWCGPCHKMDDTTWSDPGVQKWLAENAVSVQLDVDKDKAKSQSFKVNAMPTIVVMAPPNYGVEFDRQVGYQGAGKLLQWLNQIKKGKSSQNVLQDQLAKIEGKGGKTEVDGRMFIAEQLLASSKYQEAAEQVVWLWKNIPKEAPALMPQRFTSLLADMAQLAKICPPAKSKFSELRDQALKDDNRLDWMALNSVFGDENATLKWFDQVKEERKKYYAQDNNVTAARERFLLQDLLIRKKRFADVALYLYTDPIKKLNATFERVKERNANHKLADPMPREAAMLYTCFLAANLDDQADKLARESVKLDNSEEMRRTLVVTPFKAGFLKPSHLKWLDDLSASSSGNLSTECARLFLAIGFYQKALDAFDRALAAGQRTSAVYCYRGIAHFKLHQDDLAMKDYDQAEKIDPKSAWPWVNRSSVYFRQRKFQQASDTANKAIELDPRITEAYCNRGEAAFGLDKLDQAEADLTRAVKSRVPSLMGEGFYYRSQVYKKQGKADLAEQDKRMADMLKFSPDN